MVTKLIVIVALIVVVWAIAYLAPIQKLIGGAGEFLATINRLRAPNASSSANRWSSACQYLKRMFKGAAKFAEKFAFLQTYGDALLDQKIRLHLTLFGSFILAMGLLEASAWSYLGYLLGHDAIARWLCAAGVFVLVFFLVWGMDVSLAIYDRLAEMMSRQFEIPYEAHGPGLKLAVPIRMCMLAASLIIAAPLLASIVFRSDIEAELRNSGAAAIAAAREHIAEKHDVEIKNTDAQISTLQHRLDATLVGKGDHQGIGCGIECRNLESQIEGKKLDRSAEVGAKNNEIAAFNHDAANWESDPDTLRVKWNVSVPRITVLSSAAVLTTLKQRDDFRQVEWAIRFLFLLAFASVVICKLYESHAAALYNNSILQGMYRQDPPGHPISAEHYYKRVSDQLTRDTRDRITVLKTQVPELQAEINQRQEAVQARSSAHEAMLSKLEERMTERDLQQRKVNRYTEEAKNFKPELYTPAMRWMVQQEHQTALEEEERKLALLETEIRSLSRAVEKARAAHDSIDDELKHFAGRLSEIRLRIAELESSLITGKRIQAA